MLCKIYLNDGENHFLGFLPDFAELTMVHSFETSESEDKLLGVKGTAEMIFEFTNTRRGPIGKAFNEKMLRSLSVGDVVTVGETAWAVDRIGFVPISTEDLQNSIIANDEDDEK